MPAPVAAPVAAAATPAPTPTPATPVEVIEDEEVPLAVVDTENEEDVQELAPIEDEETPLANMDLKESVKHCILHIIELLIAGGLAIFYIGDTSKQKQKIRELKEKIDSDNERRDV
ncbi:hypothetical protein ABXS75_15595 [Roseburia hominis]